MILGSEQTKHYEKYLHEGNNLLHLVESFKCFCTDQVFHAWIFRKLFLYWCVRTNFLECFKEKHLFHQFGHKKIFNVKNVVTKREYSVASIANVPTMEDQTLSIQHFAGNKTNEIELKSSC